MAPALVEAETDLLPSGDESGAAPGDRSFRPDVEGLRAVAVALVVLFHSDVSVLSGGYVGVDVFFVISCFAITGVLLRERQSTGRTSILSFYGRRCRRILPAASLVIVVTVALAYIFLDLGESSRTASDGLWAAVFLANFHFIASGTNYLASQQPPSPLQNFWSLAVEEQFYVVYPTFFLLVAKMRVLSFRARLSVGLAGIIVVSLIFSITETQSNSVNAFFSPFTRAWELALGALVAVGTPWLLTVPARIAGIATWFGLGFIALAAVLYTSNTPYPGSAVILPVVGSALIIAGGVNGSAYGVEMLLGIRPFRWLGRISYSLYLWHWPILIVAAEYAGKSTLSVRDNLGWDVVALGISVITYRLIENPVRHSQALRRSRGASIGLGAGLVLATLGLIALQSNLAGAAPKRPVLPATNQVALLPLHRVLEGVAASARIEQLPSNLSPPLAGILTTPNAYLGSTASAGCSNTGQGSVAKCTFGDVHGSHTMVLYGDSHANMWFRAVDDIAIRAHWKLILLFMDSCSATLLPIHHDSPGDWVACDQWHQKAEAMIRSVNPQLLIISQTSNYQRPDGTLYSASQWQKGLENTLARLTTAHTKKVVMANLTAPADAGADCLARHTHHIQACSGSPNRQAVAFNAAERRAASKSGARYINVLPWFCTKTCSSVIGNDEIYLVNDHVTVEYTLVLEGVLTKALHLPRSTDKPTG
jgi:peptidoglycan/LPS O-acetylase OafA/YrhL